MKLIHISPSYFPALKFGGPIQSVHMLNEALVKKGIKVDVLTTNAGLSQEQRKKIKEKSKKNNVWLDPSFLDDSNKAGISGVRVKYLDFVGY